MTRLHATLGLLVVFALAVAPAIRFARLLRAVFSDRANWDETARWP